MKVIASTNMPKPSGHYSICMEHNGVLYLSAQLPIDIKTKEIPEGIEAQTQLLLENIEKTLQKAGSSKSHILKMQLFLADIVDWDKVNYIYRKFFDALKPTRMVIGGVKLHLNCLIEIEATAVVAE